MSASFGCIPQDSKWHAYALLMRLDKPIGTLLLLWPTLWALLLAGEGSPSLHVSLVFVAGVFLMRSAGCVINDFADRNFDGHVTRTQQRPLVTGRVTPRQALGLFAVLVTASFLLVLTLNRLTILLSLMALVLAAMYPFMKRVTHLPQFVLGAAFSWAIPMAFAAQTGDVPTVAWLLFLANLLWTVAYDTFYAMVDRDDDLQIGIKSTAVLFGRYDRLVIALLQFATLALLFSVGWLTALSVWYFLGIAVAAGLFLHQQWLAKDREPQSCFQAFISNNRVGAAVAAGLALSYWI